MTTETSNPFGTETPNQSSQPSNQTNEFFIHTMKEDLAALEKKAEGSEVIEKKPTLPPPVPPTKQRFPTSEESVFSPAKNIEQPVREATPFFEQKEVAVPTTSTRSDVIAPEKKPLPSPEKILPSATPAAQTKNIPSKSGSSKTFLKFFTGFVAILIVSGVGVGGFYFWNSRNTNQIEKVALEPETQPETETSVEPPVVVPPVEKYSPLKTNYLPLDLNNSTPEKIKEVLLETIQEVAAAPDNTLYEFIVVDTNNNPVAFPIFATASKINFSQPILGSLSENFSLFLFKESSGVKLGFNINVDPKKAAGLAVEMSKKEKFFPVDLNFIFIDNPIDPKTSLFKESSYEDFSIRYLNLTENNTVSIDYTIKDNQLLLGTSKDAMRAMIDYLLKEQEALENN